MSRRKFIVSLSFAPDKFGVGDELTKNVARNNVFLNVYAVLEANGSLRVVNSREGKNSKEEEVKKKKKKKKTLKGC